MRIIKLIAAYCLQGFFVWAILRTIVDLPVFVHHEQESTFYMAGWWIGSGFVLFICFALLLAAIERTVKLHERK